MPCAEKEHSYKIIYTRHFPERIVTLTRDHNSVMALMLRPQSAPSRRAEKKSGSL